MLSEVYLLRQALERAEVQIPREHPRVKKPGFTTGPCLRIRLEGHGHVTAVETLTWEEWPGLWTVMEGNHNSFPVVRIKHSIFDVPRKSDIWRRLGFDEQGKRNKTSDNTMIERLSALEDVLRKSPQRFSERDQKSWQRLRSKAEELLRHSKAGNSQYSVLPEFAQRFQKAADDPKVLLREIAESALKNVKQARLDALKTVETLFVGDGPPDDRGKKPPMTVQLAFDLEEDKHFPSRLYSQRLQNYVKLILPIEPEKSRKRASSSTGHPASACAFTGKTQPLQVTPFPKVKLPVLNREFPLVSMFSEADCNKRYGLTDARIVPVGREAALRMQDALAWIVAEERRGKTWRDVANGRFEIRKGRKRELQDLLIVYVDGKPEIHANVADLFGTDERLQEKQFEVDAQAVCKALEGIEKEQPGSKLNLFLLRKASEGQANLALAESPAVKEVLDAARRWQRAVTNVPELTLPLPAKEGEKPVPGHPRTPYPDQVVRLLSEEWVTNGTRSNKAQGVGLSEVLDLMLRKPDKWESAAQRMLDLTLRRLGPLLVGLFGAMSMSDKKRWNDYPGRSRETALRAVSVLGILLDTLNSKKEEYMKEAAFQIGQMLALADTLHRDYCIAVRKGSMPSSLIGNAMMPHAFDNPRRAIADLADRMRVYAGWAKVAQEPSEKGEDTEQRRIAVRQAWKTLRRYEPLAARIHDLGLPEQCTNLMKAELLLGYLASPKMLDEKGENEEFQKEEKDE